MKVIDDLVIIFFIVMWIIGIGLVMKFGAGFGFGYCVALVGYGIFMLFWFDCFTPIKEEKK